MAKFLVFVFIFAVLSFGFRIPIGNQQEQSADDLSFNLETDEQLSPSLVKSNQAVDEQEQFDDEETETDEPEEQEQNGELIDSNDPDSDVDVKEPPNNSFDEEDQISAIGPKVDESTDDDSDTDDSGSDDSQGPDAGDAALVPDVPEEMNSDDFDYLDEEGQAPNEDFLLY